MENLFSKINSNKMSINNVKNCLCFFIAVLFNIVFYVNTLVMIIFVFRGDCKCGKI